jgi:hypothetical protein
MDWLFAPVVIAALIAAAAAVWRTLYKASRPPVSKSGDTNVHVHIHEGSGQPNSFAPNPGPGSLPIKSAFEPRRPALAEGTPSTPKPPPALDFPPVAADGRYDSLESTEARQAALARDLYRVSGPGLRMVIPGSNVGARDS